MAQSASESQRNWKIYKRKREATETGQRERKRKRKKKMTAGNRSAPRSVADATRFTSNTPHANTKSTSSSPNAVSQMLPRRGGPARAAAAGAIPQETMEERVRRLRAAHLAAKQHNASKMDQIIASSRRFFDAAHKYTIIGFIGFSGMSFVSLRLRFIWSSTPVAHGQQYHSN